MRTAPRLLPPPLRLIVADDSAPVARPRQIPGLHRVRHGVYAPLADWTRLPAWHRYLARVHAVALVRPGSVFCLESAASLQGMPVFGEPRDIHVFDADAAASRRFGDVAVHTSRTSRAMIEIDGIAMTAPVETAIDLARTLPPAFGLAVVDAVIAPRQLHTASWEELAELDSARAARRGVRRSGWILESCDARSESPGESVSRAVLSWLGFPAPLLQEEFCFEGVDDRADFFWPRQRTIGESDGYGKYDAADTNASKSLFVREKVREDRLRRHVAGFARWDWSAAMRVDPLRRIVLAAGVPIEHPVQPAMLASLRTNPRSVRSSMPPSGNEKGRRA